MPPVLRPMLATDVDRATEMILGHGWGVRREWLTYAVSTDQCVPLVAEQDGEIVATGVGTANGAAGWVGSIFVAPAARGRGLGRSLTQEILDRLASAGCVTFVLVATADGRRLYERMGFEVQTQYRILQAIGLPPAAAEAPSEPGATLSPDARVREFEDGDLGAILRLDREGTGEDREHVLRRFASPDSARVSLDDFGRVDGFVVRATWGGGATIASSPAAALRVVTARRRAAGPEGRVRVGLLDENAAGLERLTEVGFRLMWSAPRMIRGAPLPWRPETIWGQLNHAMG